MVKSSGWNKEPWAGISAATLERHGTPGAMLRLEEKRYLYWLVRDQYEGLGAILDLGPLTGGSTVCLAGGALDSKNFPRGKAPVIRSYDLFYYDGTWGNLAHRGIKPGDDFYEVFLEGIEKVRSNVVATKGDILEIRSFDEPIEILFVDLAKSERLLQHVMKVFYPRVLVGNGIVVHQDYKFVGMPYLKAFQQAFAEYFELLPFPADVPTVAFRLVKPLPEDFAQRVDALIGMKPAESARLLREARDQFQGSEWHIMNASLIFQLCAHGDFDGAAAAYGERRGDGTINKTAAGFYTTALERHPMKAALVS